jgi:hypothetical protein
MLGILDALAIWTLRAAFKRLIRRFSLRLALENPAYPLHRHGVGGVVVAFSK